MGSQAVKTLQRLRELLFPKGADRRFFTLARCLCAFVLGAALSCARVLGHCAPFGLAYVACAGPGLGGVSALLGSALATLLSGGLDWGIRYLAGAVLVYTVSFLFHELPVYRSDYFLPLTAALVMALTGFLSSFTIRQGAAPLIAELLLESALAFAGAYFYRFALSAQPVQTLAQETRRNLSLAFLLGSLLMALAPLKLGPVSLGHFLALLLVMCSAQGGGLMTGAAVGTVLGLAMDLCSLEAPFYTMAYAFAGLFSGVFYRRGRLLFALSFVLAQALSAAAVWTAERALSPIYESFAASLCFLILPSQTTGFLSLLPQPLSSGRGEAGLRRFVSGKLKGLGDVYGELYETVLSCLNEPHNDENIAKVFDRAADRVCYGCPQKNRCWNEDVLDTLSAMNDASLAMKETGCLKEEDLPGHFKATCPSVGAFVQAVNTELRSLLYRRQLRQKLQESRSVAWGQFGQMSRLLFGLSEEIGSLHGSDPLAEQRLQRYLKSLEIDAEVSVYRDGGGRLHVSMESMSLAPLLREEDYLDKLSSVVGVRLCQLREVNEESAELQLLEAEPLAVSVGIAAMKKRGEQHSGDKGSYFKTDAGVLCVILSDGMGTGSEAAQDSERIVGFLERFLRSGLEPAAAMRILNSVMLLQSSDSWGYTTVDLVCVDLFTGETCFYKYGAAPSYVKSGHGVKRVEGETLALGLNAGEGEAPDVVRMRLKPGSTALIATDGVVAAKDDDWLKSILERGGTDMKELARSALKEAEQQYGAADDMTVIAIRVEQRV